MKYRPDLDGLRALAVLSVVIFHVQPNALPGGFIGVDIFFVISGYLITIILWDSFASPSFSFLGFYARRSRRLLPALYVTLACTLLTALAWFPISEAQATAASTVSAVLSMANIHFSLQAGYFDVSVFRKPLLHTWSLAVEEQFYLIWPLILRALYNHRHRMSKLFVLPVILLLAFFSEAFTHKSPSLAYFLTPFRFYEFLIGAVLHLLAVPTSFVAQEFLSITGIVGIFYSFFAFSGSTPFPGLSALLPTVATALLIQAPTSTISQLLSLPFLTTIGRISYSVYLVHWPLIVAFRLVSSRDLVPEEAVFLGLASFALGYALHHSVETRFRSPKSNQEGTSRQSMFTLLRFAAIGLTLCLAAHWTTILASFKFHRNQNKATEGPVLEKTIEGLNITSIRHWTRRMNSRTDHGWVHVRAEKYDVPGFNVWRAKYHPAAKAPRARLLLIGDSHATSIMPAFARIAIERDFHLDVHTTTGCPALFGVKKIYTSKKMKGGTEACMHQQKLWQQEIEENPYDFVVLATRWTWHFENSTYGKHWIQHEKILDDKGKVPKTVPDRRRVFEKGFRSTIKTVVRSGAHAIAVSQAPNVGKHVKGCLQLSGAKKSMELGVQPKECVGVSRNVAMQRLRFIDSLITRIGYQEDRVSGIILSKYCCDNWEDSYCRSIYDGKEMYGDDNHLNNFGAIFSGQRWEEDLFDGLNWSYRNPNVKNGSKPSV